MKLSLPIRVLVLCDLTYSFRLPEIIGKIFPKRQVPAEPSGVKIIYSPNNVTIRYKEPGKEGICETTPGVNSYSGYVDLDEQTHMFFWLFESRQNASDAPITVWLNGGPGSDSLIGLFEELGPCYITPDITSNINTYSWSEASNMLFLSQPVGVGFSYAEEIVGAINETTELPQHTTNPTGRYPYVDSYRFDTTKLAAIGAWEVLQAFFQALPTLDANIQSQSFNLWTESYGGHYGPTFYRYFYEQNLAIEAGNTTGYPLSMNSLGIINGIISERIQAPYYPEFAYNNSYGLKTVNETIYDYMKTNYYFPGGCRDVLDYCAAGDRSTPAGLSRCAQATAVCRGLVEGPFYAVTDLSPYDIRVPASAQVPPTYWQDYLNLATTQDAVGVNLNYSSLSIAVSNGFDYTGDFVYDDILLDLEAILDYGVQVALVYGDADYICNWFGGEAVSLQLNYTHATEFRSTGYEPFVVQGVQYGETRQHGNFSFTRIYDAGHKMPYYQPEASLELFRRVIKGLPVADGD